MSSLSVPPLNTVYLGQQRVDGDLSIAVDPNNSATVYVCYGDQQSGTYTLHVVKSTDSLTNRTDPSAMHTFAPPVW